MVRDVMVFVPVYRLEPETVTAVLRLAWHGPLTWVLQRDNPHTADGTGWPERYVGIRNHLHQYQRGRALFLQSRCEALLVIESDIIPPVDTLQRLAQLDADVAYGCYMFRSGTPVVNVFERYEMGGMNVGESLTVRGRWEWARQQGVVVCSGGGLGCVLIKRHVLEQVDFRVSELETARVHCDTWFTNDVYGGGFRMMADTAVLCGHKTPEGAVLWPPGGGL